jgi:DNA-binding GntR family transcriptional regulator
MKKRNNSEQSMRERAYLHIQQKIATREIRPGIPVSELSVAGELGISRTPTREALRQLITEGLLQQIPGRGAVVAQLTRQDIIELYETREALEKFCVGKAASQSVPSAEIERLRKQTDEILLLKEQLDQSGKTQLDEKQMNQFQAADIGFHALLARAAGNSRFFKILNETRALIQIFSKRHKGHDAVTLVRIYQEHCEILQNIADNDAERAAEAVVRHIHESRQERMEDYDSWEREAALKLSIGTMFNDQRETQPGSAKPPGNLRPKRVRARR